jgi:hypothetical protein
MACPKCDEPHRFADDMGGEKVQCKNCERSFTVRTPSKDEADEDDKRPSRTAKPARQPVDADEDEPRRKTRRRRDEDDEDDEDEDREESRYRKSSRRGQSPRLSDDDDDRPRRRKPKKKSGSNPLMIIGIVVGVLLGIGAVVAIVTFVGKSSNVISKFTPQKFDTIKLGVSEKEVIDLLGAPDETQEAGESKTYVWKDSHGVYRIRVVKEKVVGVSSNRHSKGIGQPWRGSNVSG